MYLATVKLGLESTLETSTRKKTSLETGGSYETTKPERRIGTIEKCHIGRMEKVAILPFLSTVSNTRTYSCRVGEGYTPSESLSLRHRILATSTHR